MYAERQPNQTREDLLDLEYDENADLFSESGEFEVPEEQVLDAEALRARARQQRMIDHFEANYNDPLLRPHQLDAMEGYRDMLASSVVTTRNYALLHAPGSGKTVWAAAAANAMGIGRTLGADQPMRALFLGPELRVLTQAAGKDTVTKKGFALTAPDVSVTEFTGKVRDADGDVVTMTYDMLCQEMAKPKDQRTIDFDLFDVVFYDECHDAIGPTTLAAVKELQTNKINIGMTGTPLLEDGRTILDVWPNIIHQIGLAEGIEGLGILNSLIVYTLRTGEHINASGNGKDFSDEDLKPLMSNKQVTAYTVRLARLLASHNAKTVIFGFPGGESLYARNLSELLAGEDIIDRATGEGRRIRTKAIGSFRNGEEEKNPDVFDAFDRGELDVITSVKMGEVGWDPVHANCIILACPTRSARVLIQRIGRGLRIQGQPTILIHFDYEVEGPGKRGALKTPYEVLERPESQGMVVQNPNDDDIFSALVSSKISDLSGQQPTRQKRAVRKTAAEKEASSMEKIANLNQLLQEVSSVIEEAETISVKERRAYRRNESQIAPPDHFGLEEVGKMVNMSTQQLVRILRFSDHQAYSLMDNDGERRFFCTPQAMEFLDANVAHPGEATIQDIATYFGATDRVVATIAKRLGVFGNRHEAFRRDDPPRDSPLKVMVFSRSDRKLVIDELQRVAVPILPSETPLSYVMEQTGRSRSAVQNHLADHYNIAATMRRVGEDGRSGTLCVPTVIVDKVIDDLRDVKPLPADYKEHYLIMNEVGHTSFAKNRGMTRQDVEETISALGIQLHRFRRSGGHSSEFISREDLVRLKDYILEQPAPQIASQFKLPLRAVVEIAGIVAVEQKSKTEPTLEEEVDKLGSADWDRVSKAIQTAMTGLKISLGLPKQISGEQQVRNAERILARIVMDGEPEVAAIVKADSFKGRAEQVTLQSAVKTFMRQQRPSRGAVLPTVAEAARELDMQPKVLLNIMKSSYRPGRGDTRVVYTNGTSQIILSAAYNQGLAAYVAEMRKKGMIGNGDPRASY
ncbi:MAG: DEAD/DEAH box helicase [Candidatus Saccharibacteria bacterium]